MMALQKSVCALAYLASLAACWELVVDPKNAQDSSSPGQSLPIDISKLRNNRAFAMSPNDADFDGTHSGYPAQYLPPENFTFNGVNYIFPTYQKGNGSDNVVAQGQSLDVPKGRYISVHMLAAAESSIATGYVNATYSDGSRSSSSVLVDPFWDWPYRA